LISLQHVEATLVCLFTRNDAMGVVILCEFNWHCCHQQGVCFKEEIKMS